MLAVAWESKSDHACSTGNPGDWREELASQGHLEVECYGWHESNGERQQTAVVAPFQAAKQYSCLC